MPETDTLKEEPKFLSGSIFRHILVMTSTASIGLMAIFLVDFANLFYISLLGKQELAAAIGYAGTIMFFTIGISVGFMIATSALVAKTLGAGDRESAKSITASALIFTFMITTALMLAIFPFLETFIKLLGASGETLQLATDFLKISFPSMPVVGLALSASGILRALGDAKSAMYVTLGAGISAALLDPIFIFTFDLGIYGAAIVIVLSRIIMVGVALYYVLHVHKMFSWPTFSRLIAHTKSLIKIAIPAVLTNIATPVGNAYITSAISAFGDEAVAGFAIIGRIMPVAFGFIYALSGAVGPIIGQNFGASSFERVEDTIKKAIFLTFIYTLSVWVIVLLLENQIILLFSATGNAATLVSFFIQIVILFHFFNGILFVSNASFNNLGFASYSTYLNWAKATLGTIPFVFLGGLYFGARGVLIGEGLGALVFGLLSLYFCKRVLNKIRREPPPDKLKIALWQRALSAFSSGKSANIS